MPARESFDASAKHCSRATDLVTAVRRNHALEHATIALLLKRPEGRRRLVGRSGPSGFHLYGEVPTPIIEETVHEALRRLQQGEAHLAVSPMCGTNLVVAGISAGVASMIAGRGHRGFTKLIRVIEASILALVIAQPLGRLAQKHVTTTADLSDVSIARVVRKGSGKTTRHKIEVIHQ